MSLETGLAAGNVIEITFPDTYIDELGISYLASDTCSPSCTISSRTVSFTTLTAVGAYSSVLPYNNCKR